MQKPSPPSKEKPTLVAACVDKKQQVLGNSSQLSVRRIPWLSGVSYGADNAHLRNALESF